MFVAMLVLAVILRNAIPGRLGVGRKVHVGVLTESSRLALLCAQPCKPEHRLKLTLEHRQPTCRVTVVGTVSASSTSRVAGHTLN